MKNELKYSKEKQIGRKIMDKPRSKAIKKDEVILQRQCEGLLDWLKVRYIRVPDCIWNYNVPAYIRQLAANYFKGLPDLTILFNDNTFICVELKTKTGRMTQGQKNFAKYIPVTIIRSFEDFEKLIKSKLDIYQR